MHLQSDINALTLLELHTDLLRGILHIMVFFLLLGRKLEAFRGLPCLRIVVFEHTALNIRFKKGRKQKKRTISAVYKRFIFRT